MASSGHGMGEAEVFETPDPRPLDSTATKSHQQTTGDVDKDIDTGHIAASTAFDHFLEKDSGNGGHDGIYRDARKPIEHPRIPENPMRKYERLKKQVAEFMKELECMAGVSEADLKKRSLVPVAAEEIAAASKGIVGIRQQLASVISSERLRPHVDPEYQVTQTLEMQQDLSARLLRDVEAFSQGQKAPDGEPATPAATPAATAAAAAGGKGCLTYELYYGHEDATSRRAEAMNLVEKRLCRLEQRVTGGSSSTLAARGNGAAPPQALLAAVNSMEQKVAALDPRALDSVSRRMKSVVAEYESFTRRMARARKSRNSSAANPLRDQRLTQAIDKMETYEQQSALLPTLITRLQTLRSLHEESALFSQRLQSVESAQSQMLGTVTTLEEAVGELEASMGVNMATVVSNVEGLDKRLQILTQTSLQG